MCQNTRYNYQKVAMLKESYKKENIQKSNTRVVRHTGKVKRELKLTHFETTSQAKGEYETSSQDQAVSKAAGNSEYRLLSTPKRRSGLFLPVVLVSARKNTWQRRQWQQRSSNSSSSSSNNKRALHIYITERDMSRYDCVDLQCSQ